MGGDEFGERGMHVLRHLRGVAAHIEMRTTGEQIADARSLSRFTGDEPDPRAEVAAGHIPGSRHVHYARFFNEDGTWKSPDAIRAVRGGGRSIDPQLAIDAWSEADPLNDRERQVLRLAGDGLSAGDIATLLNLSPGTVRNYLSEAIGKLGAGNRIEAFRLARQKGWL